MDDSKDLQARSAGAAKWSLATEVIVKIISPISQLVLARLLAPEAFGMVATVTMVVSFADMFADAGFQKYLVQHSFRDKEDLHANANVAFWTNFCVSVVLWCFIAIFNDQVASFVGNPSLGLPLAVACLSLPLTSFSSIQTALFHRNLDFKSLMPVRLTSSLLNFSSTLALAFMGFGYWSLIVGTLLANVVNAVGLTLLSEWKPRIFYSLDLLKAMFSFSGWTLLESFTIWLSTWAGTFIVGHFLGATDLGYYKTPVTFVSGCFGIITNATTPILFSSLSRLQFNRKEYVAYLRRFQFMVALFLLPLSAGIFIFREPLVALLLGDQWGASTLMFGLYGLVQGPMVLLSYYSSEMYRSLGKPRVSTLVQVVFLVLMTPLMTLAAMQGFDAVVWADAGLRVLLIAINQVVTYFVVDLSCGRTLWSLKEPIVCTFAMCAFAWLTYGCAFGSWLGIALDIFGCIIVYFAACLAFPKSRRVLLKLVKGGGLESF
ncbi:lipopolysaccharide biosynthesis protein [Senegalimassilia anaerobia]